MALPSAVPERPSALKLLVLFFLRCFLRLACGDGGGSILGLVVLEMLGLEHTESPRPVSANGDKDMSSNNHDVSRVCGRRLEFQIEHMEDLREHILF